MDIYFSDFTPEAQKRLLDEHGVKTPEELNWDILPIIQLIQCEENDDPTIDFGELASAEEQGYLIDFDEMGYDPYMGCQGESLNDYQPTLNDLEDFFYER